MRIKILFMALCILVLFLAACSQKAPTQEQTAEPETQQQTETQTQEQSTEVECNNDSDCGQEVWDDPYCFQGSILTPHKAPKCFYPGTVNSYCRMEQDDKVELCTRDEFCRDGRCLVIAEQPCKDTDGGKVYDERGTVTDGKLEVFNDQCKDDETVLERYCSHGTKGRGLTEEHRCGAGEICKNGACVEEE